MIAGSNANLQRIFFDGRRGLGVGGVSEVGEALSEVVEAAGSGGGFIRSGGGFPASVFIFTEAGKPPLLPVCLRCFLRRLESLRHFRVSFRHF